MEETNASHNAVLFTNPLTAFNNNFLNELCVSTFTAYLEKTSDTKIYIFNC